MKELSRRTSDRSVEFLAQFQSRPTIPFPERNHTRPRLLIARGQPAGAARGLVRGPRRTRR
jgi:hypothetical protein